jgi:ATP-dependent Clp protease ATP-binding subunit ClpB
MTSNLGSQIIQEKNDYAEIKKELDEMLYKYFKPEFLNRIDEIITFRPLNPALIREIAHLEVNKLVRLLEASRISVDITDKALAYLAELGFNPILGARPLKRVIQQQVQDRLSMMILEGKLLPESHVNIDADDTGLSLRRREPIVEPLR